MKTSNDFGLEVVRYRSRHKLSQSDLAEILDVSYMTISRWEIGKSKPSKVVAERFYELVRMEGVK